MSIKFPGIPQGLSILKKLQAITICRMRVASHSGARLAFCLSVSILICGCFFFRTPFDFPSYPVTAKLVNVIEGYQSRVGLDQYNMWSNDNKDRYAHQHLQIHDHYLYVAQCGLTVFDISHPERMLVIGDYPDHCGVDALAIVDGRAYLAARDRGITVLDVTKPAMPTFLGMYDYATSATDPPFGLVVRNDCIYLYTPASKLAPGHRLQPKSDSEVYSGWYAEIPVWQVIRLEFQGKTIGLQRIRTVDEIGRPQTHLARYLYAATQWTASGSDRNTYLQSVELQDNCGMRIVNAQTIPAVINDMKAFKQSLFGAVGNTIWVWDISDPQHPLRLGAKYNVSGRIGDFITIDVDDARVLGRGYSLWYDREAEQVYFRLNLRIEDRTGPCTVWMNPDQPCKSQVDGEYRGVNTGRNSVLFGDYVFYPYDIATDPLVMDHFDLVDFAIMTYKLP